MPVDDDLESAATQLPAVTQPSLPSARSVTASFVAPLSVIADRYDILGLLGMGGMGRVYRAHDRTLDEIVALKVLRAELLDMPGVRERFRQEVKLARRVTSPHVVRTFDLGQHEADHFLTMEYIDGQSLAQRIDDGPLPLDESVRIARAVAAGISAAHAVGVLHRDLKPDNVLIARDGRIVITDFGIAMVASSPTATLDRFAGTPAYMAPEQVERGAPIGPPTDIYAFGAIAYEMLTGERPFPGGEPIQVAIARLREPPPDPRARCAVPDALAELVLRCMARAPSDRFADGSALAAALAHDFTAPARAEAVAFAHVVPARSSRSVAILPLRAAADLAELADGLGEEIVDALSQTRALRVRPLASLRKNADDVDARELGRSLGVDVVVDGSVRRRGEHVRIAARAIGIADGFLLWANHFDARPDALLAASDEVVRAIASALTVEIDVPARAAVDPRATELYLSAKARLRARWLAEVFDPVIADLERARVLAPDDAAILATLATAYARQAFFGGGTEELLVKARELSTRATEMAPGLGEAWFSRAVALLYSADVAAAAPALVRALVRAPGFAMAQAMLGGIMLEAGDLDSALAHLEAAESLDPLGLAHIDLPRAYIYAGRWDDAMREIERARERAHFTYRTFDQLALARYKMWRGERFELGDAPIGDLPASFVDFFEIAARIHRTGRFEPDERARAVAIMNMPNPRMRATRSQFMAEFLLFAGDPDAALEWIDRSVDAGLQDHMWMERCPLLAPLRDRPEFRTLAARVAERARAVVAAVGAAATT